VNRVDTTLPTITCPAATDTCTLVQHVQVFLLTVSFTCNSIKLMNCTACQVHRHLYLVLVVTQSPAVGTAVSGVGTTVITLTVTDASGNSANCTFNVNRVDTTLPTITCPAAQTLVLSATCAGVLADYRSLATIADNCTASGSLVVTQSPAVGTAVSGVGTTVITLTVTDASGNSANCTFNVNRVDTTLPTITCPAAQTLVLSATCAGVLADYRSLATVADNCTATGALTVTQSPAAGTAVSGVGTTVITLTVTDASGNSANCTFNVNRVDTTAPVVTCPGNQTIASTGACTGVLGNYVSLASATDNCTATGAITITQSPAAGTVIASATTVTITATDAAGNSSTCTFLVTPVDNTAPSITCPAAQTLTLSATCAGVLPDYTSLATVSDNCTPSASIVVTQSPAIGSAVSSVGTTTITLTATDAAGNASTCNFDVNRVDTTLPTITCPAAQTLVLSATCAGVLADYRSLATVADNCTATGSLVVTQSPAVGTAVSGVGTTVITLTVTDASGNSANCTFNVNRVDTTLPTITCPAAQTLVLSATCAGVLADYRSLATIADNCTASGSLVVTQSPAVGTAVSGVGTTVITLTVTDASGNSANCTFNVNRVDTTLPTITCPAAQTLVLSATCAGVLADYRSLATVADNCTATGALTVTQSPAVGTAVSGVGTTVITLTVTDASGNSANCTFNVNRVDTTAPVVTCPGNQTIASTGACTGVLGNYVSLASATDNCTATGAITITQSPAAGNVIASATTVTITATDAAGNSSTCTFLVTPVDNTAPSITCPAAQTLTLSATCAGVLPDYTSLATVSDNCTPSASIVVTQSPAIGSAVSSVGTTTITLTATDAAGNASTCNFDVNRVDTTLPTITCPAAQTLVLSATCAGVLADYRSLATVADNCTASGSLVVTQSPAVGTAVSGVGTTVITLTVTDASGNSANCTFNVNRVDTTLPTITCPAAQTLVLSATCAGVLADYRSLATIADNCTASGALVVTQSPAVGTAVSGVGTTVITLTVTDASGNSANCTFNVNRVDTTLPTITCPAAQTLVLSATCAGVLADYRSLATVADNCTATGALTVTQSPAVGTAVSGVGTTVITLTVTDASGNSANCTFNVNRVDTTAPVVTCPGNQTIASTGACTGVLGNYVSLASATDNCTATGAITITQSPAAGTVIASATTVTITATDAAGNSSTCTFLVTPVDNTAPSITCPAAQTLTLSATCAGVLPDYTSLATVSDNCTPSASIVVTQSPAIGSAVSSVGTTTITLTATDAAGNASTCNFDVNRVDTTLPTITCPAAQTLVLSATCAGVLADYRSLATVADNCTATGALTVTQSPAVGTAVSGVGTTVITLTVTDDSGNSANCTFNVNRVDTTLPTITCPAAQTLVLSATCAGVLADYRSLATIADNCTATGALTVTQSPAVGTAVSGVGTTVITLTVTDASGNSANCTFNVNRVDTTLPTITCPAAQTLVLSATCAGVLADYRSLATVADNCTATGALTVTQSPAAGTAVSGVGTTVITLTVTDASGNSANCTFNVNRVDTTAPVVTCPGNQTIASTGACTGVLGNYVSLASATDNCTATGAITITQSPAAGTVIASATTVTITATDAAGNSSTCTFLVTPVDNTAPSITCPAAQTLTLSAACAGVLPDYTSLATVSDNCTPSASIVVTQSPAIGSAVSSVGTTTITLTATDAAGNASTCNFDVNRVDTTLPTITCPAAQTLVLSATCAGVLADYRSLATIADNCTASGSLVQ
jgi:hypothetical protein